MRYVICKYGYFDLLISYLYYFNSLSFLVASTTALSTILKKSRDSGYLCFTADFSKIASSISPFRMKLSVGFSYIAFIMMNSFP